MCHMSNVFAINLRSQFSKEMKKICIYWYYNRSHLNYVAMKPPFNPLPKKHCFTTKKKKKTPFNHLHHIPSKKIITTHERYTPFGPLYNIYIFFLNGSIYN